MNGIENRWLTSGLWLTDAKSAQFISLAHIFREVHPEVTYICVTNGDCLFNYVPNTNYCWHLLVDNRRLNSQNNSEFFCFNDLLKRIILCSRRCTAGTPVEGVGAHFLGHDAAALDYALSVDRALLIHRLCSQFSISLVSRSVVHGAG